MELHERLKVFYARLEGAPPCASAEETLALVCRLIEQVEDEFCPVPRENPPPRHRTGRMYPPRTDSIFAEDDGIRAETRRHTMYFSSDGSIRIVLSRTGEVEFTKRGGRF
jgi:hypothetical protein